MSYMAMRAVLTQIPNLVGYWKFQEGPGTVLQDYSGHSNHGVLKNGPTWVDGKVGSALEFDGEDDYVGIHDDPSLDITDAVTVAVWVNQKGEASSDYQRITEKGGVLAWWFQYPNGNISIRVGATKGNTAAQVFFSTGLSQNQLYYLAFTYDKDASDRLALFVDGDLFGTSNYYSDTMSTNNSDLIIGNNNGTNRPFNGLIDELRIYDRALSAAEIKAIYRAEV